jgi:hypothetical protein
MISIHERAWRYVAGIESVPKAGGSTAAFTVALALSRGFNLSRDEAWPILIKWNRSNARPPWSEAELRHKLDDAIKNGAKPFGFLLNEAVKVPRVLQPMAPVPPPAESPDPAADRAKWPALRPLSTEEARTLADLRNVPVEAVAILESAGLLQAGTYQSRPCYFIREADFCQARALDGKPLQTKDGPAKSVNLKGSRGAFFGAALLGSQGITGEAAPVLLVEGCVGLLEAVATAYVANQDHAWTCLAATSSGSRFERAPELLARLAGRRVRIIPDLDPSGVKGATSWESDLIAAGATVDLFELPEGIADLGPLVAAPDHHRSILIELFSL